MRTKSEILRQRVQAMRERRARDALRINVEATLTEMVRLPAEFWEPMYARTDKYEPQVQLLWDGKPV